MWQILNPTVGVVNAHFFQACLILQIIIIFKRSIQPFDDNASGPRMKNAASVFLRGLATLMISPVTSLYAGGKNPDSMFNDLLNIYA